MKRICFGSIFVLLYQARGQGVTSDPLCNAILASFGVDISNRQFLAGHLKNGHDKIPTDIIERVRAYDTESAAYAFEKSVMPLIKDSLRQALLLATLAILDEDEKIDDNAPISWLKGYTKAAALSSTSIDLTYFLASLVRLSVLDINNHECEAGIREIPDNFVEEFSKSELRITIDEPGIILKWPSGEIKSKQIREYLTDDEVRSDVETLKKLLSKYKKPEQIPVPVKIDETEMTYVEALYEAYASAENVQQYSRRDVERSKKYKKDFVYQRKCYYATETIRRSLQDALLPIEYKEFNEMEDEIEEGIFPKMTGPYDNGYLRLSTVTSHAVLVPVTRSQIALLPGWIGPAEKVGMCHMLANQKKIQWVDEDE